MRVHKCDGPEADETGWAEGKVDLCPSHGQRARTQIVFKSRQTKRNIDRATGVVGTERGDSTKGGYISGRDLGR
jgi:hypothetical protein